MRVTPGSTYEARLESGVAGLTGTIRVGLLDSDGDSVQPLLTTGIIENPAGSGIYFATRTAPNNQGAYTILWSLDGSTDPDQVAADDLTVTYTSAGDDPSTGADLCTLDKVKSYVPAYRSEAATDALLADFITSESALIPSEAGREIIPFGAQPATRSFTITARDRSNGRLPIGDLASADDTDIVVELLDMNEANPVTVDRADYRPLYRLKRQAVEAWEPVTQIEFLRGAPALHVGRTVLVTGSWGFPAVPPFIREACAKRVILRYVSDVASRGTAFADAIDDLSLAGMFASSRDAIDRITIKAMIR